MSLPIESLRFDDRVSSLLRASDLPTQDLPDNPAVTLFGCVAGGTIVGVIGLEIYDSTALLRSLAVSLQCRGQGIGNALLLHAEQAAASRGATQLFLLTTTAERYFAERGYGPADRDLAPPAIAGTRQFASLCPSSSAFLVKSIR